LKIGFFDLVFVLKYTIDLVLFFCSLISLKILAIAVAAKRRHCYGCVFCLISKQNNFAYSVNLISGRTLRKGSVDSKENNDGKDRFDYISTLALPASMMAYFLASANPSVPSSSVAGLRLSGVYCPSFSHHSFAFERAFSTSILNK